MIPQFHDELVVGDLIQLAERMELLQCIARVQVYTFLYIVVTPELIDQRR